MGFVLLVVAVLLVIWLITYLMRPRGPRPRAAVAAAAASATICSGTAWAVRPGARAARPLPRRAAPASAAPALVPAPALAAAPDPGWSASRRVPGGGFSSGGGAGRSRPSGGFVRGAPLRRLPFRRRLHPRRRRRAAPLKQKAFPPSGEGGPQGRMRGELAHIARKRVITVSSPHQSPIGDSFSLPRQEPPPAGALRHAPAGAAPPRGKPFLYFL